MITNEMAEGFSELLLIIDNINEVLKNKIPIKFINFLNENKSDSYIPNIDLAAGVSLTTLVVALKIPP